MKLYKITRIVNPVTLFLILLLFIAIIVYGLIGFRLSFFYDDLSTIRYFTTYQNNQFINNYVNERILLGQFYSVTLHLFTLNPLIWQTLGIILRWSLAVGLFVLLNQIWPEKVFQNRIASLLSIVFPGFSYHWIILTYSHAYLLFLFGLWSILLTLQILQNKKLIYLPLAVLLAATNILVTDYFLGIELFRYLAIFLFCAGKPSLIIKPIRNVLLITFLGIDIGYVIWRFLLFDSSKYNINLNIGEFSSWEGMRNLFLQFWNCTIGNWINALINIRYELHGLLNLSSLVLIVFFILIVSLLLVNLKKHDISETQNRSKIPFYKNQLFVFAIATLFFMMPFVGGGFPLVLARPYDRFQIAFILTSSVLLADLLSLIQPVKIKIALISVIIGLSACSLFQTSISFYRDQQSMIRFLDQLSWRIPDLAPNTMLISDTFPFTYYSENTINATINQIFDPPFGSVPSKYALAAVNGIIRNTMVDYQEDEAISICDRDLCFNGNTSQIIYYQYFPSACIRILDPIHNPTIIISPDSPIGMTDVVANSNIDLIHNSENIPELPFYLESYDAANPEEDWCFYFQRAELARQFGEWDEVIQMYDLASERGLEPTNETEYYPLIDAYIHLGQIETSFDLSRNILTHQPLRQVGLCYFWEHARESVDFSTAEIMEVENYLNTLNCH